MIDINFLSRRQAIAEWRDRQYFAAVQIINGAGMVARSAFDGQIVDADLGQSLWDPAAFVDNRIDALMREAIAARLHGFLGQAADELRALDESLASLAQALAGSGDALIMPQAPMPSDTPVSGEPAPQASGPKPSNGDQSAPSKGITRRFGKVRGFVSDNTLIHKALRLRDRAAEGVSHAADSVSRSLQDSTGLYSRLRRLAQERVAGVWMGDTRSASQQMPFKLQLIALIEDTAHEARSMTL
ncbi:hypothetical protein [Novosphingobium decolorationis]|uniref:Uncharacterized protein n=1 Tax=Novosphingobium decolorationis TaxID=2698673 RepID=A0ABX8E7R6_9SPHN|nr:hypothetical protein [Novosphingobium decolorationis]QVM85173.1 hypothetical protein HT578_17050 [Novosphingobium decolorationis]